MRFMYVYTYTKSEKAGHYSTINSSKIFGFPKNFYPFKIKLNPKIFGNWRIKISRKPPLIFGKPQDREKDHLTS